MIDNNPPDYFFDCMVEKDVRKYLTTRNIRWNINEKDIHIKANKTKKNKYYALTENKRRIFIARQKLSGYYVFLSSTRLFLLYTFLKCQSLPFSGIHIHNTHTQALLLLSFAATIFLQSFVLFSWLYIFWINDDFFICIIKKMIFFLFSFCIYHHSMNTTHIESVNTHSYTRVQKA